MTFSNILLLLLFTIVETWAQVYTYDNYKVFRLIPKTEDQLYLLWKFVNYGTDYDVWKEPTNKYVPVDIMVPPYKIEDFYKIMKKMKIQYEILINNVQKLIDQYTPVSQDNSTSTFDWNKYNTLDEINSWLIATSEVYSDVVSMIKGGSSYEGRDIVGVKVSYKDDNQAIVLEGGIHAREWISPAILTYILKQLLTNQDLAFRNLVYNYDWYIFPVVNPDGYEYSHNTDRFWKKSRQPYTDFIGADLNRNWDIYWNHCGASDYPGSNAFPGTCAFSEVETRTFSTFICSIQSEIVAYFAFHSYSQLLLFPYGHTHRHLDNYEDLFKIGQKARDSLSQRYGTEYIVGSSADILDVTTGTSVDWVKAKLHIPITYSYELRDTGNYGFLLPPQQIIPTAEETLDSIVTIMNESISLGY